MENPEQPGSAGTDKFWGHVQAAILQTIKQDKPLPNHFIYYSKAVVHYPPCSNLAKHAITMNE